MSVLTGVQVQACNSSLFDETNWIQFNTSYQTHQNGPSLHAHRD